MTHPFRLRMPLVCLLFLGTLRFELGRDAY